MFRITNDSGVKWKRVRLRLEADETFGTYLFPRFTALAGGVIYYGRGVATFHDWNGDSLGYNEVMKVVVAVQHGHLHRFTADIEAGVYPEGMTELRIYAKPTAD